MIPHLVASQFIRGMTVGRTAPILCGCEDQRETGVGEYVVKLFGNREQCGASKLLEIMGSRLASHFDILVPEPAAVEIGPDFAELVAECLPHRAASIRASVGLNFGSRLVNPMATWLVDKQIPEAMLQSAVDIFAFDVLIQNPDRRFNNPNLFTQGDNIFVYDHETSFSFLLAILPQGTPWDVAGEAYLDEHVFFHRLKGKEIDLSNFAERLVGLTDDVFAEIRADLPPDWVHGDLQRIETHLRAVREHSEEFVEQVKRRLV